MTKIIGIEEEIRQLKHKLYNRLLNHCIGRLTKEEIDIMYSLSKDREIQETLEKAR